MISDACFVAVSQAASGSCAATTVFANANLKTKWKYEDDDEILRVTLRSWRWRFFFSAVASIIISTMQVRVNESKRRPTQNK